MLKSPKNRERRKTMLGFVVLPQLWSGIITIAGITICLASALALVIDIAISTIYPKFDFAIAVFWVPSLILGLFLSIFGWLTVPGVILTFGIGWIGDRI